MYRDQPVDARILELEALIASEPALRSKIAPLELEHDELQGRLAVLGAQLSEAEGDLARRREGGVRATVSGWIGRSLPELEIEVARLADQHTRAADRFAEVVEAKQALTLELARCEAAGDELATLLDRSLAALRLAEGPAGDEVRALDADDLRSRAQREAIAKVRDTVEIARTAVLQLETVASDLDDASGLKGAVGIVLEVIDSPFETPDTIEQRDRARVRLGEAFEFAVIQLIDLVGTYDSTGCAWFATMPRDRVHELASRRRAKVEDTELVREAKPLLGCLLELARGLTEHHNQLVQGERERMERRRELVTR